MSFTSELFKLQRLATDLAALAKVVDELADDVDSGAYGRAAQVGAVARAMIPLAIHVESACRAVEAAAKRPDNVFMLGRYDPERPL